MRSCTTRWAPSAGSPQRRVHEEGSREKLRELLRCSCSTLPLGWCPRPGDQPKGSAEQFEQAQKRKNAVLKWHFWKSVPWQNALKQNKENATKRQCAGPPPELGGELPPQAHSRGETGERPGKRDAR
jgi:hypothetical protein